MIEGCDNLREVVLHGAITREIASKAFFGSKLLDMKTNPEVIKNRIVAVQKELCDNHGRDIDDKDIAGRLCSNVHSSNNAILEWFNVILDTGGNVQ